MASNNKMPMTDPMRLIKILKNTLQLLKEEISDVEYSQI